MSRIPNVYLLPLLTPLNWRDEESGELPEAVRRYYNRRTDGAPSADQLSLIIDYLRHFINAPCWARNCAGVFDEELASLREQAEKLASIKDIEKFLFEAMEIGLDPF
jgi:hypothetical protein